MSVLFLVILALSIWFLFLLYWYSSAEFHFCNHVLWFVSSFIKSSSFSCFSIALFLPLSCIFVAAELWVGFSPRFLRYVCANTAGHCVLSAGDIGGDICSSHLSFFFICLFHLFIFVILCFVSLSLYVVLPCWYGSAGVESLSTDYSIHRKIESPFLEDLWIVGGLQFHQCSQDIPKHHWEIPEKSIKSKHTHHC